MIALNELLQNTLYCEFFDKVEQLHCESLKQKFELLDEMKALLLGIEKLSQKDFTLSKDEKTATIALETKAIVLRQDELMKDYRVSFEDI